MPPLVKFILRRLLLILVTLVIVTALLYGVVMLTPVRERATLYLPRTLSNRITPQMLEKMLDRIIIEKGLDQPYPVQYLNWVGGLVNGEWGWSPAVRVGVLDYLTAHIPVTFEITLYSLLFFVPLGVLSGVWAAQKRGRLPDHGFRLLAFTATSIPPFILGLMMISFFYVGLHWFAPGRLSAPIEVFVRSSAFHWYTGLATIDGLLNGRLDVTLDAFKHLAMPVVAVSALHWATLARVTRASLAEELDKEYIVAAQAWGVPPRTVVWRHALRNALVPALTSGVLSAASLLGGVYVIEIVFDLHGVSELITTAVGTGYPDAPAALGFVMYSVMAILTLMFILDLLQAIVDPRLRERISA